MKDIRTVYGETLAELAETNGDIVVLDADVSSSTKTGIFAEKHPDRFFNMGIAEANMVATAAGLASAGKTPFVNTFAVFMASIGLVATRSLICYARLNVKLAGAYCGLSDAFDGASHHATEDISILRSLPNMTILVPSDEESTRWATRFAAEYAGPVYLRLSRDAYPELYPPGYSFEAGRGAVVRDGNDVTVVACGILVHEAMKAAEALEAKGLSVRVVDMYSVKPIDRELLLRCARETGAIVTAEEHSVTGGLGGAVAEVLAGAAAIEFVGVQDRFTESGPYGSLLGKYGLDAAAVAAACERAVVGKK